MVRLRDQITALRDEIRLAAASNGARDVRLFGSVARGEDGAGSDVDFLVTLDPGRTMLDLARLELRLEAILGRRVDVMTEGELRGTIRDAALADAVHV
jgi:predicted nucleotidyltransferase